MKKYTVFTYGTLLSGEGNHHLLETSTFIDRAVTKSSDYTFHNLGWFPGLVRGGSTKVHGEVYEIDEPTLHRLHRLEGHPTFYEAQEVDVVLESGEEKNVITYIYQGNANSPIESGKWKE